MPFLPQNATPYSPQPTAGSAYATQQPQAMSSVAPSPLPFIYIAGAFLVVIVAALLFFREKSLSKALHE